MTAERGGLIGKIKGAFAFVTTPECTKSNIKNAWRKFNGDITPADIESYVVEETATLYGFPTQFLVGDRTGRRAEQVAQIADNHARNLRQSPGIVRSGITSRSEQLLRRCGELPPAKKQS